MRAVVGAVGIAAGACASRSPCNWRAMVGVTVAVLLVAAACGSAPSGQGQRTDGTAAAGASPAGSPPASAAVGGSAATLPSFVGYQVSTYSIAPAAKVAAARAIEKRSPVSVTNVSYTQYFGYSPSSAAVLVLAQTFTALGDGAITESGTTYNVSVRRRGTRWEVTSVRPADRKPPGDQLSTLARSVLGNDRILLPPAPRADVLSGTVSDVALKSLTVLAKSHVISVSVISSAHPIFVFGTQRRSDHPFGYAFDVGAIDGQTVIDPAHRDLVVAVMREAKATGAYQVGGPVDPDGPGAEYFTDATHQDHIHVGFRR